MWCAGLRKRMSILKSKLTGQKTTSQYFSLELFCSIGKTNPYRPGQTTGGGEEFAVQAWGGKWWTTRLGGPGDGQSQTSGRLFTSTYSEYVQVLIYILVHVSSFEEIWISP